MTLRDTLQAWLDSGSELTVDVVRAVNDAWAQQRGLPRVTSETPYLPRVETTGTELTRLPDEQTCEVR